jgi:hypothetical protein
MSAEDSKLVKSQRRGVLGEVAGPETNEKHWDHLELCVHRRCRWPMSYMFVCDCEKVGCGNAYSVVGDGDSHAMDSRFLSVNSLRARTSMV